MSWQRGSQTDQIRCPSSRRHDDGRRKRPRGPGLPARSSRGRFDQRRDVLAGRGRGDGNAQNGKSVARAAYPFQTLTASCWTICISGTLRALGGLVNARRSPRRKSRAFVIPRHFPTAGHRLLAPVFGGRTRDPAKTRRSERPQRPNGIMDHVGGGTGDSWFQSFALLKRLVHQRHTRINRSRTCGLSNDSPLSFVSCRADCQMTRLAVPCLTDWPAVLA